MSNSETPAPPHRRRQGVLRSDSALLLGDPYFRLPKTVLASLPWERNVPLSGFSVFVPAGVLSSSQKICSSHEGTRRYLSPSYTKLASSSINEYECNNDNSW